MTGQSIAIEQGMDLEIHMRLLMAVSFETLDILMVRSVCGFVVMVTVMVVEDVLSYEDLAAVNFWFSIFCFKF